MNKGLITKMIVVAILGIAVIAVVVGMMFTPEKDKKRPAQSLASEQADNSVTEVEGDTVVEIERMLALVKAIDSKNNVLTVYDIERELTINLVIDSTVIFEDEYGTMLVADQLLPGYIVNVKYDKNSFIPIQVKVAPQIQTISKLSSFILNEELKTIQIGSDIYSYNEELIAFDREKKLTLAEITEADDVIIRAYKNIIWSIIREKGHGYIVLANYDAYLDGTIEIGNRTSYTIVLDMKIPVTVGVQNVIITKSTMTPYTSSVLIAENEEYMIDLSEYQPKVSQVIFRIIQEGATLFINDVVTPYDYPVVLDFGQYDIKVKLDGYKDWKGILLVETVDIEQIIDMETEPRYLIISGPEGAEFYMDGILKGTFVNEEPIETPILDGGHILTIRKEGFISWSQSVLIEENGENYYFTVPELTPIEGTAPPETEPTETLPTENTSP